MKYLDEAHCFTFHDNKEIYGSVANVLYKILSMIFPQYFLPEFILKPTTPNGSHNYKVLCVEIVGIEWKQNIVVYSIEQKPQSSFACTFFLYHMGYTLMRTYCV